jgi:hypothetical protein
MAQRRVVKCTCASDGHVPVVIDPGKVEWRASVFEVAIKNENVARLED